MRRPMQINNHTPFAPFYFRHEDHSGESFNVFLLKGTFHMDEGRLMRISQKQAPVNYTDKYRGDPTASSLLEASDLAPIKERTDVTFSGTATPPGGVPANSWELSARIGMLQRRWRVYGPREWNQVPLWGWTLSKASHCASVPLTFENCFGGTYSTKDQESSTVSYSQNPVGKGWCSSKHPRRTDELFAAHQIEDVDTRLIDPTSNPAPAGVGPVCRHWDPRIRHSGTADAIWQQQRWPRLPEDFSFEFYNHAPVSMQLDGFLVGGEEVSFENVGGADHMGCFLPIFEVGFIARTIEGEAISVDMNLDTAHFYVDERIATLTWRAAFESTSPLDQISTGMRGRAGVRHGR